MAKIMICKRFSLFLALFSLWYCKITLRSHCYDRFNAILTVLHITDFDEIWHGDAAWPLERFDC